MSTKGRHVGIPVQNMKTVRAFYETHLGFTTRSEELEEGPFLETILAIPKARAHIVKLVASDGWMLELLEYVSPPGKKGAVLPINEIGHAHIALSVDDLGATYRTLTTAGVSFLSEPQISPSGKAKVAFCRDPEGNHIELVEVLKG